MPDTLPPPARPCPRADELAADARRHRTRWQGATTVWREWGAGPPAILIHGGFGSWTHWLPTIPALALHRRLLVPDLPGFGESDDPAADDALVAVPDALLSGLSELISLRDGIDVVGFSFGTVMAGTLAARIQRAVPGALRHLVLVAPAGLGIVTRNFDDMARTRPGMTEAEIRDVHRRNLATIMIADPANITDETIDLQIANTSQKRLSGKPYSRSDALVRACRALPLDRIDAIWGSRDAYAVRNEPAYSEAVRHLHHNVRIRHVADAGHWVQYERPEPFNELLRDALDIDRP